MSECGWLLFAFSVHVCAPTNITTIQLYRYFKQLKTHHIAQPTLLPKKTEVQALHNTNTKQLLVFHRSGLASYSAENCGWLWEIFGDDVLQSSTKKGKDKLYDIIYQTASINSPICSTFVLCPCSVSIMSWQSLSLF